MNALNDIKNTIEQMDKHYQIEILKILADDSDTILNENSNGIFVNLSDMKELTIEKMKKYIKYVQYQQTTLNIIEDKKENLENSFFKNINEKSNKDNKECSNIKLNVE